MFTREDSDKINGGLIDIKAEIVRLETKLADHQLAFEKHENRDDKRFNGLSEDFKVFRSENKKEHQLLHTAISSLQVRLAWLFGVGIALVTVGEWLISIYKDMN